MCDPTLRALAGSLAGELTEISLRTHGVAHTEGWEKTNDPIMCAYKLCKVRPGLLVGFACVVWQTFASPYSAQCAGRHCLFTCFFPSPQ